MKKDQYSNDKFPFGHPHHTYTQFPSFDPKPGRIGNCVAGAVRKKLKRSSFGQKTVGKGSRKPE